MPLVSLIQTSIHIAILHTDATLSPVFAIALATLQALGWIIVSSIWTQCEVSPTPFCPQTYMADGGRSLSMGLTAFKDALAWIITVLYFVTIVLGVKQMRYMERAGGKDEKGFYELEEYPPGPYESRV
jgi:cytochrome bd-type quinol oxidase subunit 1